MQKKFKIGFTLLELMVVLGIIGVLIGLLLPGIQHIRATASQSSCMNNLKQIGTALHNYHATHGRFPDDCSFSTTLPEPPYPFVSWMAFMLPYLEQGPLWFATLEAMKSFPTQPLNNPPHIGVNTVIKTYVCPQDSRLLQPLETKDKISLAFTSYIGISAYLNGKKAGVFDNCPGIRMTDITDGTSHTLAVGERPPPTTLQAGPWYPRKAPAIRHWGLLYGPDEYMPVTVFAMDPQETCVGPFVFGPGRLDNPCDRYHLWSLHSGGANFLFADGSVRFFGFKTKEILPALATRNEGEVVEIP